MFAEDPSWKSNSIQGWMDMYEMFWLYQQAKKHPVVVEVGSWKGRSTHSIAQGASTLYFVDTCEGAPGDAVVGGPQAEAIGALGKNRIRTELLTNMNDPIKKGVAFFIESSSLDAINILKPIFKYRQPDMVFIDGDHSYNSVRADILGWGTFFKEPGLLCGHDREVPDVKRAINELVPGWKEAPGSIWYVENYKC